MVAFLSGAWLELRRELSTGLPERLGVSARVQHVVTGGPDGEVRYRQVVADGRVVELTAGDDPDAEVTLTETYADARQVAQGELDARAAFMQGRTKVVGPMGSVMALLPLTSSPEQRAVLAELSAQTDY